MSRGEEKQAKRWRFTIRNVAGLTTWIALSITGCVLAVKNGDKSYAPILGVVCLFCFGGSIIGGFIGSLIGGTRFDYQLGFMLGGFLIFILLCGVWARLAAHGGAEGTPRQPLGSFAGAF